MKTLSRDEMKNVLGGTGAVCYCSAGGPIICGNMYSKDCFNSLYSICGGLNGVTCSVTQ